MRNFFFAANWNQTTDADQDLSSTEIQAYNTPNLEKIIYVEQHQNTITKCPHKYKPLLFFVNCMLMCGAT